MSDALTIWLIAGQLVFIWFMQDMQEKIIKNHPHPLVVMTIAGSICVMLWPLLVWSKAARSYR